MLEDNFHFLIFSGAKAFSKEQSKIGEFILVWQMESAKLPKLKEIVVNIVDLRNV